MGIEFYKIVFGLDFADFYALMPSDNSETVAPGADVLFPQNGPFSGTAITRASTSSFNLSAIGSYQVMFQVSVTEPGQLVLTLKMMLNLPIRQLGGQQKIRR